MALRPLLGAGAAAAHGCQPRFPLRGPMAALVLARPGASSGHGAQRPTALRQAGRAQVALLQHTRQGTRAVRRRAVAEKEDYEANATDPMVLRLRPNERVGAEHIANCFGYPKGLLERYTLEDNIGRGSFGVVNRVVDKETGLSYACKSIPKISKDKKYTTPHDLLKIRAEVDHMYLLGGSLDAVFLWDVFEDGKYVHMVMDLCTGGPLLGSKHDAIYDEQEVVTQMRSVMRFLAQCHDKGLMYRDVKPENFLFIDDGQNPQLKATDFGLAMKWDAERDPPMTHPAGTPLYLSPEMCKGCYGSQTDVYSAGVMCFQLLTGMFPYWPNMEFHTPTMKELFSIIEDGPLHFEILEEKGVSSEGQDFIKRLLQKDPKKRMTAAESLEHPWLKEGSLDVISDSMPFGGRALQRIQNFAVSSRLKQMALTMMANDIISRDADITTSQAFMMVDLRTIFDRVDEDRNSNVTVQELLEELEDEGYVLSPHEFKQLASRMDVNRDGTIGFDEFVTSLLDWHTVQHGKRWGDMVLRAFHRLDNDGDGFISVPDLTAILTRGGTEKDAFSKAKELVRDFDFNSDGLISWEEFDFMMSHGNDTQSLDAFDSRLSKSSYCSDEFDSFETRLPSMLPPHLTTIQAQNPLPPSDS